jgi:hypothetical protein
MALRFELRPSRRIDDQLMHELDERVVRAVPHHSVAFYRGRLWLLAAGLWTLGVLAVNAQVAALFPVFPMLAWGGWLLARTRLDWFVVTDMRILRIQGVFNVRYAAMSLSRIVDFTMEEPFWGRLLGYGHLVFENAAQDQGLREIRYVGDVASLNKAIQQLVFEAGGGPARHKRVGAAPFDVDELDMDATGEIPAVR